MSDEDRKSGGPDRLAQLVGLVFGVLVGGYVASLSMSQNDNSFFGAAIFFLLIGAGAGAVGWKFTEALRAFLSGDLFDDWERVARRQGQIDQARKDAAEARRAEAKAARDAAAKSPSKAPAPAAAAPAAPAPPDPAAPAKAETAAPAASASEGADAGVRPAALASAREGGADDLKQIKGVGPKLEAQLNAMGFHHFDQIAGWTDEEVAWVDDNLEGFRGRVSRDGWVEQAKLLAAGGDTEFSKRVEDGDVY